MNQEEINIIKEKADKWDALQGKIESFYFDENGNELPEDDFDLCDIGEAAAQAFGLL